VYNSTVAWITLRALLGRKRALLFLLPAFLLIVITIVLKAAHGAAADWPAMVLGHVGLSAVLPLTALLVGTSVLGSEVEDNSVLHLLATPVSRASVILTKTAVAAAVTVLFTAVPELAAGIIASGSAGSLAFGLFAGALVGSVVYACLFVLFSTVTRHPVAYGLAYVALWEGLISNLVSGTKYLSVEQWSLGVANSIANDTGLNAHLTATTALILAAVAVPSALYTASTRLRSFTLPAT
jgi:ABC-2 type transport system permease protein